MRERKKSSVTGQANSTAELPENSPYWKSNWEFSAPEITPEASVYAGPGDFSGETYWEPLDDSLACSQRFKTKAIFFPPPSDGSMGETAE